jgi:ribosomal protein S27E
MARMKGELITVEAVRLHCGRCGHPHVYHGKSRERCLCTKCGTTIMFDVVKEAT